MESVFELVVEWQFIILLLTIFAIHRYLFFLATSIRRTPQQQVLCGSIESKAFLSYAADSVGASMTPLTQLVGPGTCAARWADDLCRGLPQQRCVGRPLVLTILILLLQSKRRTPLGIHYNYGGLLVHPLLGGWLPFSLLYPEPTL